MIRIIIIAIICWVPTLSWSQVRYTSPGKASAFAGLGTASYYGDLKSSTVSVDVSPSITAGGAYYFGSPDRLSVRGEVTYYRISAADSDSNDPPRLRRNLSFASSNFEFNIAAVVSLFSEPITSPYQRTISRRPYNLYGFIGAGVTTVNPTAELNGTKYNLADFNTELVDYGTIAVIVPLGLGLKYKLNSDLAVLVEAGYRVTLTDYLDDVSTTYPGQDAFSNRTAAALSDRGPEVGSEPKPAGRSRGNPGKNDNYMVVSIKIEYLSIANLISGGNPYDISRTKGPRSRPYR